MGVIVNKEIDMTDIDNKELFYEWLHDKEKIEFPDYCLKRKKIEDRKKIMEKLCKI